MLSSGMLRHATLVKTEVSEEISPSIIRVTRIGELGTSGVTSNPRTDSCHPDDGGDTFLRTVGFYTSHMASQFRRRHSS
jgi:hypothetical protein